MSYCINPNCRIRENPDNVEFCLACGNPLLINDRYWLNRPLRHLHNSPYFDVFEVDDRGTPKVLKSLTSNQPKYIKLFEQEAKILINLNHRGIPNAELGEYFPFVLSNGRTLRCLVMERIEGQNLEQWLQENEPISQDLALQWLRELAEILGYVHQQGFFHRDVKPSNIMLKPDGKLVLIDFGTAREVTQTVVEGRDVTVVHSYGYTAPEQMQGRAVPQSDFFALGRTFVYLLTGQPPDSFRRDSQTEQLIWSHARQVSEPLANFIDKLMAPLVENRPQNTQIILQHINYLTNRPEPSPPPQPDRRLPWVVAGLALVLLVGVLVWWDIPSSPKVSQNLQHGDDVNAVAFSPDGKYLATASLDNTARVWETTNSREVARMQHNGSVVAVTFSPKGKYLATASLDGTVLVRNMSSGTINPPLQDEGGIIAVTFSPDEQFLATANANGTGQLWDVTLGQPPVAPLEHEGAFIRAVAFSPNGNYLATADLEGFVKMWKMPNVAPVGDPLKHDAGVLAVAFSPDEQFLATASADGKARVWKVSSGELIGDPVQHNDSVVAVTFSPDGNYLATLSLDNIVRIFTILKRRETWKGYGMNAIAFSPNWKYLAAALPDHGNAIHMWKLEKFSPQGESLCLNHNEHVAAITFSQDENYLATASWDNTARLITPHKCN